MQAVSSNINIPKNKYLSKFDIFQFLLANNLIELFLKLKQIYIASKLNENLTLLYFNWGLKIYAFSPLLISNHSLKIIYSDLIVT